MRTPALLTLTLVLLGLIPIVVWGYAFYGLVISYDAAGQGARKAGQAVAILLLITLALTPSFIGGLLMWVGAALLQRRPWGSRMLASIGIALLALTIVVALVYEVQADASMLIAAAAYLLVHCAVLVWIWRGYPREPEESGALAP